MKQDQLSFPLALGRVDPNAKLTAELVADFSRTRQEPDWLRQFRVDAFKIHETLPQPVGCAGLPPVNLSNIDFYRNSERTTFVSWEPPNNVMDENHVQNASMSAQIEAAAKAAARDTEGVFHQLKEEWQSKGVIFTTPEEALKRHPDLFREHFATVVKPYENSYAALNSAVWSGGTFIYVPKGVKITTPLQTQIRLSRSLGQFERTLIIVDENAFVHYVEGCTAQVYTPDLLHAGVVEIRVKRGGRCRFTTIQNFSSHVFNVTTKGAHVFRDATVQWVDGNMGSRQTIKRPFVRLLECGARAEVSSVAFAGEGQCQEVGAFVMHAAPHTQSQIVNRSVSRNGGKTVFQGRVEIARDADKCESRITCDGLLLDGDSTIDIHPRVVTHAENCSVREETAVRSLGAEQLFYLESRGLSKPEATKMVVTGFLEPLITELPMEYAVEMKRLIELEMEDVPQASPSDRTESETKK